MKWMLNEIIVYVHQRAGISTLEEEELDEHDMGTMKMTASTNTSPASTASFINSHNSTSTSTALGILNNS